jgi:hypothetical protein
VRSVDGFEGKSKLYFQLFSLIFGGVSHIINYGIGKPKFRKIMKKSAAKRCPQIVPLRQDYGVAGRLRLRDRELFDNPLTRESSSPRIRQASHAKNRQTQLTE